MYFMRYEKIFAIGAYCVIKAIIAGFICMLIYGDELFPSKWQPLTIQITCCSLWTIGIVFMIWGITLQRKHIRLLRKELANDE